MYKNLAILGGKPVRKEFLPYGYHWIDDEDIKAVSNVLKTALITQGAKVQEFETRIADYCNVKYAVAFSSGTAALHAACAVAGITKNNEVITTPISFAASATAVLYCGGKPVFADIKNDTLNIDPEEIQDKISKQTKAILPVDFTGQPCEYDEINKIARDNDLFVIEDAAHALGAEYKGKQIGSFSDMTVLSFHPVKAITTGEGGMVLTDKKNFFEKLKIFRHHGITKSNKSSNKSEGDWYYEIQNLGHNYRITDFQCALGISQMDRLDQYIKRRQKIAAEYNEAFKANEEIITPKVLDDVKSAYHLYVIQIKPESLKVGRKEIFDALRAENIGVHVHYIPIYYHPFYQKLGYKKGLCPTAEHCYEQMITLPLFPKMSQKDVEDVIEGVKKVTSYYLN